MTLKKSAVMCALPVLLAACDGIDLGDWAGSDAAGLDSANLAVPVRAADCSGTGVVGNLSADDFLSVREGPGTQYARFAKLQPGTPVHLCTQANGGKWVGVVYSDDGTLPPEDQCFGSDAASGTSDGQCRSGWVAQRYVVDAGSGQNPDHTMQPETLATAPASVGAQSDWVILRCDYVWEIYSSGEKSESAGHAVYRFNADVIERWVAGTLTWKPECDPAYGGFTQANCLISESAVAANRLTEQDGEIVREDSFGINRMTGAYSHRFHFHSVSEGGNASGSCRPTEDPSAGLRPRF